MNWPTSGNSFR